MSKYFCIIIMILLGAAASNAMAQTEGSITSLRVDVYVETKDEGTKPIAGYEVCEAVLSCPEAKPAPGVTYRRRPWCELKATNTPAASNAQGKITFEFPLRLSMDEKLSFPPKMPGDIYVQLIRHSTGARAYEPEILAPYHWRIRVRLWPEWSGDPANLSAHCDLPRPSKPMP